MKASYINHNNRFFYILVGIGHVVAQDPDANPDDICGG